MRFAVLAMIATLMPVLAMAQDDCPAAPEPVLSLDFDSRYAQDDESRSEIDADGAADAGAALEPVDDFLRDLTRQANAVFDPDADAGAIADCVLAQIASWAQAGALAELGSETARITFGSRLAGFALVLMEVEPHATTSGDLNLAKTWLAGMAARNVDFWEVDASEGARSGNLRAWAALGVAATAAVADDGAMRLWAAWSTTWVLCSASPDGSLPQEMRRGRLALHYQLHAIAPLVVTALLLERQGLPVHDICDGALSRVVRFAVDDLAAEGRASRAITGEAQNLFDGSDEVEEFQLAWIEAYLQLPDDGSHSRLDAMAAPLRPLNYSKLGGNQTALWGEAAP